MEIREATDEDVDAIRSIAQRSLNSSYTDFLEEETIEDAIDQWYDDSFADDLETENTLCLVVETDDGVAAFSECELVGEKNDIGQILWLHVDPDHRADGTGVRLLVRTREELREVGAQEVRGHVLADNEGGNAFYANHGFEHAGTREVEIGDETYTENVYVESDGDASEWRTLQVVDLEGETIHVSYGEAVRGSKAPFYNAYESGDASERYGWFCGNCDSLDNAMDSMGRIECNVCGNRRKATRWDASYL